MSQESKCAPNSTISSGLAPADLGDHVRVRNVALDAVGQPQPRRTLAGVECRAMRSPSRVTKALGSGSISPLTLWI